ncbi:MAG TPA: HAD-IA family hydrolase [Patescibacteria group bacterium]
MIKAVIFDIDDTFSLTEAVCFEVENEVLRRMGLPPMSREIHLATWEMRPSEAIPLRSAGVDVATFYALYENLLAEYIEADRLDVIPDENYKALDQLTDLGMALMVLTSRPHDRVQHMLQPEHRLARKIKDLRYRNNTKFRKPDPRAFDELLHGASLSPEHCVYVGDAVRDATAAKKAGLYFIATLESGLRQRGDFDGVPVDMFIDKFPDVVSAVMRLESSF